VPASPCRRGQSCCTKNLAGVRHPRLTSTIGREAHCRQFSPASLGVLQAEDSLNTTNINLVGLAQTGIEYSLTLQRDLIRLKQAVTVSTVSRPFLEAQADGIAGKIPRIVGIIASHPVLNIPPSHP